MLSPRAPIAHWSRWRLVAPIATACACAVGAAYVYSNDPWDDASTYPLCPLYAATGFHCSGCGLTRATYRLLHGDVIDAFRQNAFVPVFVALAATAWMGWFAAARGRRLRRGLDSLPDWSWVTLAVALIGYGVVRNLPFADFLAPT